VEERRRKKVNSLLKEVLAEVVRGEIKNPDISMMTTITKVEVAKDLREAKVYISVMELNSTQEGTKTLKILNDIAGCIGVIASKKVRLRYFPSLQFFIDDSYEKYVHIENILDQIN